MPNTKRWGPSLPSGRTPRRRAQSGHTILRVGRQQWAAPLHRELPTPGRANGTRLGGRANRVLAPVGVSVRFRRCAAARWRGPWPGAPLAPEGEPAPLSGRRSKPFNREDSINGARSSSAACKRTEVSNDRDPIRDRLEVLDQEQLFLERFEEAFDTFSGHRIVAGLRPRSGREQRWISFWKSSLMNCQP